MPNTIKRITFQIEGARHTFLNKRAADLFGERHGSVTKYINHLIDTDMTAQGAIATGLIERLAHLKKRISKHTKVVRPSGDDSPHLWLSAWKVAIVCPVSADCEDMAKVAQQAMYAKHVQKAKLLLVLLPDSVDDEDYYEWQRVNRSIRTRSVIMRDAELTSVPTLLPMTDTSDESDQG